MTELTESAKSFFRFVIDLTSIYEIIQQGSSNISMGLYMPVLSGYWLDQNRTSDSRPRYCIFSSGVFYSPSPVLYVWRKPCSCER